MRVASWLAVLMVSSPALAQQLVTGVTYDVENHDDVRIEILGASPLEAPRIRTQRGQIRAWFPRIDNNPRVRTPGDGTIIEALQLRPGVADTAVLTVELAGRVRLDASAIHFEPTARGGTLHISREGLPAVQIVASVTPVVPEQATAEPAGEPAEPVAMVPAEEPAADAPEMDDEAEEAATPLFADRQDPESTATSGQEGRSMGGLLLISLLLGVLYMLIKTAQKKRKIMIDDDIAVVATKRLGPRYQLMVVRALGQDHLLSIHRGQTQVLSSMSSPTAAESAALEQSGLSILDRIQGKVEDTVRLSSAPPAEPMADEDRFGAKLLNLQAIRQRLQNETSESDAVAGLMRLRARAAK